MKSKVIAGLLVLLFTAAGLSAQENPWVTFQVQVFKEVSADVLKLNLSIEKKAGTYAAAASDCNRVLNRIREDLLKAGFPEKGLKQGRVNSLLNQSFFGKEYRVSGSFSIELQDFSLVGKLGDVLSKIDQDIKIGSMSYELQDKNAMEKTLMKAAGEEARFKKGLYEDSFGVKLEIFSIEPTGAIFDQVYDGRPAGNNYSSEAKMNLQSVEVLSQTPQLTFWLTLNMRYKIK